MCPPPKRRRTGGKQLDPVAASEDACTYNTYIYICRWTHKGDHPVLGQPNDKAHCPHRLCTLCVVAQPPDFLVTMNITYGSWSGGSPGEFPGNDPTSL